MIAHESGVANAADPLGGSWLVEKLTNDIEAEAPRVLPRIDEMGGMVAAVERGFPQREIQESAFRFQQAVERKEKIIVGVNELRDGRGAASRSSTSTSRWRRSRSTRVRALRARRDHARVTRALDDLKAAARGTDNLMPPILEASRAYATVGEMCDALREVFGEYQEQPIF